MIREQARLFVLDNIGCQVAGALLPWSQSYYNTLKKTRSGTHCTVAYFGDKLSPDDAAFINSAFTHSNESDGTHRKSNNHPGSVAVPAALAMAEYVVFDALDQARDREPVSADQVKQITVYTSNPRLFVHVGSIIEPDDVLGAQFSLPFSIAMRLHHGGRGVLGGNGFWDYPNINLKGRS